MRLAYGIFYTNDMPRISEFYRETIGLEVESGDDAFVSFKVGDAILGIKRSAEKREIPGHQTIIIEVSDLRQIYERLKQDRVQICSDLSSADWGENFAILDPDGNKVEFVSA